MQIVNKSKISKHFCAIFQHGNQEPITRNLNQKMYG